MVISHEPASKLIQNDCAAVAAPRLVSCCLAIEPGHGSMCPVRAPGRAMSTGIRPSETGASSWCATSSRSVARRTWYRFRFRCGG